MCQIFGVWKLLVSYYLNSIKGREEIFPSEIFPSGGGDFDHLNLFQSQKQHSVNVEH